MGLNLPSPSLRFLLLLLAVAAVHAVAKPVPPRPIAPTLGFRAEYLAVDDAGFLWIAGDQKVVQFDGVRFRQMPVTGTIHHLADSPDGWVYIAASSGLWQGRGRSVRLVDGNPAFTVAGVKGGAVVVSETHTLLLWRPNGVFRSPTFPGNPGSPTRSPDGDVYLGWGPAAFRLDVAVLAQNRLEPVEIPGSRTSLIADWVSVARDRWGFIWLTGQGVLAKLAPNTTDLQIIASGAGNYWYVNTQRDGSVTFPGLEWNGKLISATTRGGQIIPLTTRAVRTMGLDGTVWTLNVDGGLAYQPLDGSFSLFGADELPDRALVVNPARLGTTLYAAGPSGLYQLDRAMDSFRLVAGIAKSTVNDVAAVGDRLVLTFTDGFAASWSPAQPAVFNLIAPPKEERPASAYVHLDSQGKPWIGYGAGVIRLDDNLRPAQELDVPTRRRPVDVLFDPAGNLWAASNGNLAVYDSSGTWKSFGTKEGLKHDGAVSLAWHEGALWLGHAFNDDQFARLIPMPSGEWKVETFGKQTGHTAMAARVLRADSRGWLWRGTIDRGLQVCATHCEDSARWMELNSPDGIPNPRIGQHSFFDDPPTGSIWAICSAGLFRLRVDPQMFARTADPLLWVDPPAETGGQDSLKFSAGSMYFHHPSAVQARYRLNGGEWNPLPPRTETGWQIEAPRQGWGHHVIEVQGRTGRAAWHPAIARAAFDIPFPWTRQFQYSGLGALALSGAFLLGRRRRRAAQGHFEDLKTATLRAQELAGAARAEYLNSLPPALAAEIRELLNQPDAGLPSLAADDPPADLSGLTLGGRYLVEQRVGAGGFATLYRAADLRMNNRPTAIKVVDRPGASANWSAPLDRELQILGRLNIPGVVAVFDRGMTHWQQAFLVLEFIEGVTVRQELARGSTIRGDALRWMRELAAILDELHAAGVVHRDIKPENLMIRDTPERPIVVIDLGVASARSRQQKSVWATQAAGSLDYMAPEQLHGMASPAADIYSYALVFVECLTGTAVGQYASREGVSVPAAAEVILKEAGEFAAADVMASALAYLPEQRPGSAMELWSRLAGTLGK